MTTSSLVNVMTLAIMATQRKNYDFLTFTSIFAILLAITGVFHLILEITNKRGKSKKKIVTLSAVSGIFIVYSACIIAFIRLQEDEFYWNCFRDCQLTNPGTWMVAAIPLVIVNMIILIIMYRKEKKLGEQADMARVRLLQCFIWIFVGLLGLAVVLLVCLMLLAIAVMRSM